MSGDPVDPAPGGEPSRAELAAQLERLKVENEQLRTEVETEQAHTANATALRRRAIASVLLVVLGSALLPVSVLTVWTRNQVLDTDRYVRTVAPLSDDPSVISALSKRISDRVSTEIDVKSLAEDALPANAGFLAAPIAAGADNLINQATTRLLDSEQFDELWLEANRVGHDGLVAALTGRDGDVISTTDGKVVLQLGGLAALVLQQIDGQLGLDLSDRIPADRLDIDFVLVDSAQLADVQAGVRWFDRLAWFSVLVSLGLLAASVAVHPDRRKGMLHVGVGTAVSMLALFVGFAVGRDLYLTNLPDGVERPVVAAVFFDTLTRFALQAVRVLFVIGLVIIVGSWLTGPSRPATRVRLAWDRLLGRGASMTGSAVDLGPVPAWFARNLHAVRAVIVSLAVLVLLTWDVPTGKVVLLIALATLVPLGLAQLLAGAGKEDGPDREASERDTGDQDELIDA